jgi:glycosyltransferase involved in cell wall biosynthesis
MPKVSVIIPCYNYGQYLDEAVGSVLAQTFDDFEIIIVNDGSTDPYTNELLAGYDKPRTRVITTTNSGVASARNTGIAAAGGTYILPLDPDDRIAATYLQKGVATFNEHPECGIVYSHAEFFGARRGRLNFKPYRLENILLGNCICSAAIFRKSDWEKAGGYNANMTHGLEDWDFWLSLIEAGAEPCLIPETLLYYRIKEQSRSTELMKHHRVEMYARIYENHQQLYDRNIRLLAGRLCAYEDITNSLPYRIAQRIAGILKWLEP